MRSTIYTKQLRTAFVVLTSKGTGMGLLRIVKRLELRACAPLLLVGALAACDPQPVGDTSCRSEFGCEIIKLTAQDMKRDIGENYGGGVILRNAQALGQTLVVDLTLPLTAAAFREPVGQGLLKKFAPEFAGGFCEGEYADDFFDVGNKVRVRGFSKDSQLVADSVITSCAGQRK